MAVIILTGFEMPKDDILRIEICPNGQVNRIVGWAVSEQNKGRAKEVPPHEELVQRSDILRFYDENKLSAREAVMKAPTVLEATE